MIISPTEWQNFANRQLFGSQRTQLNTICLMVDQAVKKYLKRELELKAYTGMIMDAPRTRKVQLFRWTPILVEGFQCSLCWGANGNPAQFGPTNLLANYCDYLLEVDPSNPSISVNGIVTFLRGGPWGVNYYAPPYAVAPQRVNVPGALMFAFTGGYAPSCIPQDIILACCLAISKIRNMGRYGAQAVSESWNGYSFSLPSQAFIDGVIADPGISGFLNPYRNVAACIG